MPCTATRQGDQRERRLPRGRSRSGPYGGRSHGRRPPTLSIGLPEDQCPMWLDLHRGAVPKLPPRTARRRPRRPQPSVIVASLRERWKEVIGQLDPTKGMMQNRLSLTKGHMPTMVKFGTATKQLARQAVVRRGTQIRRRVISPIAPRRHSTLLFSLGDAIVADRNLTNVRRFSDHQRRNENAAPPVVLVADDEPTSLLEPSRGYLLLARTAQIGSDRGSPTGDGSVTLARERSPDLVVLDVMMPGMSGWEVCRKIRHDAALLTRGWSADRHRREPQ